MPSISHVDLAIEAYALTSTPGTVAGTSSNLSNGSTYLVLAAGNCAPDSGGDHGFSDLLVGGTVYARSAGAPIFAPGTTVSGFGGMAPLGAAFLYTAGASDAMQIQAYTETVTGTGDSTWRCYALDLADIPGSGGSQARWHQEGANSDTIVTQPGSGAGWTTLDTALVASPGAGDYLLIASCEGVPQSGVGAADQYATRVTIGGTAVSGSLVQHDVSGSPLQDICGYLFAKRVTLGAGSQTIALEANGTAGGGNIGYRRVRLHLISVDAFEDSDVDQLLDTDGETVTGTASTTLSAGNMTVAPSSAEDYLFFASVQKQATFWAECQIVRDPSGAPVEVADFGVGVDDTGLAAGDDMVAEFGLWLENVSASTAYTLQLDKLGGGGSNDYGANCAAGGGDIVLFAVRLATPAGATTHELSATVTGQASNPDAGLTLSIPFGLTATGQASITPPNLETAGEVVLSASATGRASVPDAALSSEVDFVVAALAEGTASADLTVGAFAELAATAIGQASVGAVPLELLTAIRASPVGQGSTTAALALGPGFSVTATGESAITPPRVGVGTALVVNATGEGSVVRANLVLAGQQPLTATAIGQATVTIPDLVVPLIRDLIASATGEATVPVANLVVTGAIGFPRERKVVVPTVAGRGNFVVRGHV